jgi:hypothetical protein
MATAAVVTGGKQSNHQSDYQAIAPQAIPEVFCPDKLELYRSNPLQFLCSVDKSCNITTKNGIFVPMNSSCQVLFST